MRLRSCVVGLVPLGILAACGSALTLSPDVNPADASIADVVADAPDVERDAGDLVETCGAAPFDDAFETPELSAGWSVGLGAYGNGIVLGSAGPQNHTDGGAASLEVSVLPTDSGVGRGYLLVHRLEGTPACVTVALWLFYEKAPSHEVDFAEVTTADSKILLALTPAGTVQADEQIVYEDGGQDFRSLGDARAVKPSAWSRIVVSYALADLGVKATLDVAGVSQVLPATLVHGTPATVNVGALASAGENTLFLLDDVSVR